MLVSEFDYHLPEELIAQQPLGDRAASRMLHLVRDRNEPRDRAFRELPDLLRADDLVVFNNTRVIPARLYGRRGGLRAQPVSPRNPAARDFLHGRTEVLLTRRLPSREGHGLGRAEGAEGQTSVGAPPFRASKRVGAKEGELWQALVRPGRKIGVGEHLFFGEHDELRAEVIARGEFGERTLRFEPVADFFALLERLGHVPLPPYIARPDEPGDRERYQTVFARERGSVAAPTAGLHFTAEVLERLRRRGIETTDITLHVGLGTFQPVHVDNVEQHKLHGEYYRIPEAAANAINRALAAGRRVVAVGTTTVRTLEYAAIHDNPTQAKTGLEWATQVSTGCAIASGSGEADLFIYPGFQFRVVGAMLTNFHLPKSTLLMLVCAFAGRERVLAAYQHAVREKYRFYSYGDCMFIE